jgi:hypothetical protein
MKIEILFSVASWRWGGVFLVTLRERKNAPPSSERILSFVQNYVEKRLGERNIFPQAQRAGGREKYIVVVREINGEPVEPLILTDFIVARTPTATAPKRRLMC